MTDDELWEMKRAHEMAVTSHPLVLLRDVAARVRAEALEEAAEECDALASVEGIAQRCAAAIRARAAQGATQGAADEGNERG